MNLKGIVLKFNVFYFRTIVEFSNLSTITSNSSLLPPGPLAPCLCKMLTDKILGVFISAEAIISERFNMFNDNWNVDDKLSLSISVISATMIQLQTDIINIIALMCGNVAICGSAQVWLWNWKFWEINNFHKPTTFLWNGRLANGYFDRSSMFHVPFQILKWNPRMLWKRKLISSTTIIEDQRQE